MENQTNHNEELERINKEIEAELLSEDKSETLNEKKQFLTAKFIVTLIIAIIMLAGVVKLFF
ncbi:hypothetical protein DOS74_03610 [Staphylococcus felis]|uniref:Uncharacterized protein n=1 Tax=Staphylococcus felis TaxID=46127 RepID=A0AAX1RSQ8_9STAP|nr:hypothetical protein [Staphylococcus felis]REH80700.1 hypothetical protein DOS59_01025 [Staphylococcus felis]REH84798.1 hypothetical protein DOS56_03705 [Staphylococcus felis]REH86907.1 hypothetical protein DOS63_02365 [Staphylococcus felis]REI01111.1 hypothetical protein DOS64_04700 [Staphylococcus felis]REI17447.1 hypothetical protein DOS75_04950 [Staphylococcus felis]